MADYGLLCGASPFPYDWRGSEKQYVEMLPKLPDLLGFAQEVGVSRFYTRVSESLAEGESWDQALAWHRERLDQLAALFQQYGMALGLEAIGVESFRQGRRPFLTSLHTVWQELQELFSLHANLGILVDAFHLHAVAESVEDAVGPDVARIVGVHVADLPAPCPTDQIIDHVRALPGTSNSVPVREILQRLAEMGCNAPVMVETVRPPAVFEGLSFDEQVAATHRAMLGVWPA